MSSELQPNDQDKYAAFEIDPTNDVGITITIHRGGGGGLGSANQAPFVCDTMSTQTHGVNRALSKAERAQLDSAVKSVVDALLVIRDQTATNSNSAYCP